MTKLLILGNTNVYTFCNSILAANEKSKELFEEEGISDIFVLHSSESFNKLFINNNSESLKWIERIKEYGIDEECFIHKIIATDSSMESFLKYIKSIFEQSQLDKLIIDLTNGMSEFKTTLAISSYIVGKPRTFHIDTSALREKKPNFDQFIEVETLKTCYKEIIPGRKIDEIAYMNLTEVVRYEDRIENLSTLYSSFKSEELNNSSFFQNNLLNAIKLKIQSDQKEIFDSSMYRIASTAMASSLEDMIDRFLINYKIDNLENVATLGQKIRTLENAINGKFSNKFDYVFFKKLNDFMLYLRNSTTHKALNRSDSEQFKATLSLHMLFVFVEYYSKIIYAELENLSTMEEKQEIISLEEINLEDSQTRFYGLDGDGTGSALERLFERNSDEAEIKKFSRNVKTAKEVIVSYIKNKGGQIIFAEGDDILFKGCFNTNDLQKMLSLYREKTDGMTCSIGYGNTLKETLFSMKISKIDKNSIRGYTIQKN